MWKYTDKVMDHYRNPRNVGMIEDADAVGEAGSLACGDMLKLYLKVDDKGIITDAKFQTFGCGSAVASSSILTEMIIGKPIDEVKKITNKMIADELGGLPPEKMHCSVMGHDALLAALANYYGEDVVDEKKSKIVCQCFQVDEDTIRTTIRENNLKTLEDVTNWTKAGGACGKCKSEIAKILEEELNNSHNIKKAEPLSHTKMILKVNNVIEKVISEQLRKDNGDIELIDVEGNIVTVKFSGKCHACKNSQLTLKFVENVLREKVSPDIIVKLV